LSSAVYGRPLLYVQSDGTDDGSFAAALAKLPDPVQRALTALVASESAGDRGDDAIQVRNALGAFLATNPVRKSQVPDITKSAKYQELRSKVNNNEGGFRETGTLLNRGVISGPASRHFVFHEHAFADVTSEAHRAHFLALCQPLNAQGAYALAPPGINGKFGGQFETVGAKRSADSTQNPVWKRRATGVADFADSFAPVGANRRPGGPNLEFDEDADVDWSTLNQGLTVNDKHLAFAAKIATLTTNAEILIARCFYLCKVRGDVINIWMNKNIVLPFSVIVARPHMTYDMNTCILMKGGNETGATFQGHSDFQLGDDVQSKIHYGNYTYYSKAIVTNHKNIILARNVLANGYAGGDGCKWKSGDAGDMYAFLVPYDEHKKANPLRLFSHHADDPGRSMTGALYYQRSHDQSQVPSETKFTTLSEQEDSNDICYMGHHFWWKPHREQNEAALGSYTGVTINTGHWGDRVYPGCGRVRAGDEVYLKETNYGQEVF
jgi:hypothetical protein